MLNNEVLKNKIRSIEFFYKRVINIKNAIHFNESNIYIYISRFATHDELITKKHQLYGLRPFFGGAISRFWEGGARAPN